ncbi:bifunctional heparan sulfate N-deacetylase/N-sulfotransferase [Elysia marginata]|uniref:[heparan sulfate]-glucosamine N-sulfotransferase n=1 Tax=Elysia marginata TaxID=1093978 RepID=A0AAV4F052_9GAST|nr:bifunctional heparan sulfate N-deacetylase/N-sulfotransferase [Elysia marginata]
MSTRRFMVWITPGLTRMFSPKRWSVVKVFSVILTIFITWATILVLSGSETIHRFRIRLIPNTDILPAPLNHKDLMSSKNLAASLPTDDELVQHLRNQNGALDPYISDKLGINRISGGSPYLEVPDMMAEVPSDLPTPYKKVLILVEDTSAPLVLTLGQFFGQQRIDYKTLANKAELPRLTSVEDNSPKYSLFVFDDFVSYLSMPESKKRVLDEYCSYYRVGILAMSQSARSGEIELFSDLKLKIQHRMKLQHYKLEPSSPIWRVGKPEAVYQDQLPSQDWSVFTASHPTYRPLAYSTVAADWDGTKTDVNVTKFGCVVAIHDIGMMDKIQKIIIGYDINFWLNSIVGMDAITFLSNGNLGLTLDRYVQVDVDDMFVGKTGIRTHIKDADAMAASQEKIRKIVPGFRWVLGFSGGSFQTGNPEEAKGDQRMIEIADKFIWFDHMYKHEQPHLLNATHLRQSMASNMEFAQEKKIPVMRDYMVTPHHSGIYPVVDTLYDAWVEERGVTCTSTEEYPRYVPHWERRGFIYKGVMVIPRQTCRLFTHINTFEEYQGGKEELDISIKGGYLFKVFLYTPVMIFMTHMSNYANDQLAQYSFEHVTEFVAQYTNLRMQTLPPVEIAKKYFQLYPDEVLPIWTNPCDYNKHMETWPKEKSCDHFPSFVIVGPQKTGTTALHTFLEAHPALKSSKKDPQYFEEVQFFNNKNYAIGIDWYMKHFDDAEKGVMQFEKSANYFDNEFTPQRMFALLPNAKIVVILAEPARRAYSWYQHLRSHEDPTVMNYTFYEVVSSTENSPRHLRDTRNRCLKPGEYATHLSRWLKFYPRNQIFLVDGDQLNKDPIMTMNKLQKFIAVTPYIDYYKMLRFDKEKGFYCLVEQGCLSPSKGRKYNPMDAESSRLLKNHYAPHNAQLRTLLTDLGRPHPRWLMT